jgi:hypothetical protein
MAKQQSNDQFREISDARVPDSEVGTEALAPGGVTVQQQSAAVVNTPSGVIEKNQQLPDEDRAAALEKARLERMGVVVDEHARGFNVTAGAVHEEVKLVPIAPEPPAGYALGEMKLPDGSAMQAFELPKASPIAQPQPDAKKK